MEIIITTSTSVCSHSLHAEHCGCTMTTPSPLLSSPSPSTLSSLDLLCRRFTLLLASCGALLFHDRVVDCRALLTVHRVAFLLVDCLALSVLQLGYVKTSTLQSSCLWEKKTIYLKRSADLFLHRCALWFACRWAFLLVHLLAFLKTHAINIWASHDHNQHLSSTTCSLTVSVTVSHFFSVPCWHCGSYLVLHIRSWTVWHCCLNYKIGQI